MERGGQVSSWLLLTPPRSKIGVVSCAEAAVNLSQETMVQPALPSTFSEACRPCEDRFTTQTVKLFFALSAAPNTDKEGSVDLAETMRG